MSVFGRVLAVFNVLAALGFAFLAAADYRARNNWAYAAFRLELAVHGLPLNEKDDSWRPGTPIVKDLKTATVTELFNPVGGAGIRTQAEAVRQTRDFVLGKVDEAADDNAKKAVIRKYWAPLLPHAYMREN